MEGEMGSEFASVIIDDVWQWQAAADSSHSCLCPIFSDFSVSSLGKNNNTSKKKKETQNNVTFLSN